jgi:hypothetical protein
VFTTGVPLPILSGHPDVPFSQRLGLSADTTVVVETMVQPMASSTRGWCILSNVSSRAAF